MPFIQEQNKIREDYKFSKKSSQLKVILSSRQTKGILLLLAFSILAPVLLYYFIIDKEHPPERPKDSCSIQNSYRIPCGQKENVTYDYCTKISCCFDNSTKSCFHYLPSKYYYFSDSATFRRSLQKSPFGRDQAETVALNVQEVNENTIRIVLHDVNLNLTPITDLTNANYRYKVSTKPLYIEVFRNESDDLLLTTAKGPTIVSENYWEWTFQLTDEYLFGLGQTLIDVEENSTFTKVIYGNDKDHNTLPLFMAYKNGKWHGLVVRHKGPLEVTVLSSKLVTLKSLAGKQIALDLNVGPSVQEVIKQQHFGTNSTRNVDFATLGVHVCREGATVSLREILEDYGEENAIKLPDLDFEYESDCLHENLIMALRNEKNIEDNDYVKSMVEVINSLPFALSLPPQVIFKSQLYNDTKDLNVFFKNDTSQDYIGQYLGQKVVYPYFQHSSIVEFVQNLLQEIESYFGQPLNSFLLVKNWPSDESFKMAQINNFQYLSEDLMEAMSSTLPWNVTSNSTLQYLDHNNYGSFQLNQISSRFDSGTFMTASHNFDTYQPIMVQNVDISWTNFQNAIITTLYNSLFGFPLTSFPVCGSTSTFNTSHESLCLRWYYMAATAPIFRISSDSPRRDPNSLGLTVSNYTARNAKWAIDFRNSLKYYFYAVLTNDEPLMRPMFYDFPDDVKTFALVEQYMVGKDLLVAQPTLPEQSFLRVYLPAGGTWFEFWGGGSYDASDTDGWVSLPVVETDWTGFIREGAVIPLVEKRANDETVLNITLKVALKCETSGCSATGTLKTAENLFTFVSTDGELTVQKDQDSDINFVLSQVQIFKSGSMVRYNATVERNLNEIDSCTYLEDSETSTTTTTATTTTNGAKYFEC